MDPVLADIFVKEMRGHVKVVREFLERATERSEPHAVDEPLYRACHTLLGSGRMAGFEPAIALAGPLAEHLRRHFDAGTGITNAGVEALRAAAAEIERMADALVAGHDYSLSAAMPGALAALATAAGTQPSAAPAAASGAPPAVAAQAPAAVAEARAPAAAARADRPAAAATAELDASPAEDVYDPEIAAIFAEEAAEILDNAELALRSLRQDPAPSAIVELQRLLHTLKGGARMAGITAMGTLSHALETLDRTNCRRPRRACGRDARCRAALARPAPTDARRRRRRPPRGPVRRARRRDRARGRVRACAGSRTGAGAGDGRSAAARGCAGRRRADCGARTRSGARRARAGERDAAAERLFGRARTGRGVAF